MFDLRDFSSTLSCTDFYVNILTVKIFNLLDIASKFYEFLAKYFTFKIFSISVIILVNCTDFLSGYRTAKSLRLHEEHFLKSQVLKKSPAGEAVTVWGPCQKSHLS